MIIWLLVAALIPLSADALPDVLLGTNGERFVGKVVEERTDVVVFDSETAGRLTIARARIRELQRAPALSANTNQVQIAQSGPTDRNPWQPAGVGKDGWDWLQLKSDEWLKGHLDYVQDKKVQFESDELEDLSLKLKDVRRLYSAKPMFVKAEGRDQVYGAVAINSNLVEVVGPEQVQFNRDLLTGITPGGKQEISLWSGKASIGLNLQTGNSKQTSFNASGELARRTPTTQLLLTYLGNFSEVGGTENANNHRANLDYDIRLDRHWFFRPLQFEYYQDALANIAYRLTAGVGVGYYIFDRDKLEWKVAAGPGYQYTRFETVAANEADYASTPAAIFQTKFKADITPRLTFYEDFAATLASEQAGLYSHHLVSTLEFEIKRHLNLDVSFVWDYLLNPQTEASGVIPVHTDLRLTLGVGVKF